MPHSGVGCVALDLRATHQPTHPLPPARPPLLQLHPRDQIITAEPDVRGTQLGPDDRFLVLACDGIWDVMTKCAGGWLPRRARPPCVPACPPIYLPPLTPPHPSPQPPLPLSHLAASRWSTL